MSKPPAFQTYASDFYMDTNAWSIDEIGIYQRLLLTEWVNGSLPDDEIRLARIAGCNLKRFLAGWKSIKVKFHLVGNGHLINKKMEEVRENQIKYSESRRKNVSSRYKDKSTYEPSHVEHMKDSCSLSSSSSLNNKYSPNSNEFRLASLLLEKILKRKPNLKKPNIQIWAKSIDLMIRIDKRKIDKIETVINWCQQDEFWEDNILSTEKLRKQFDQLELKMSKQNKKEDDPYKNFEYVKGEVKGGI